MGHRKKLLLGGGCVALGGGAGLLGVIGLGVGAWFAIQSIDPTVYGDLLEEQLTDLTGRELRIDGAVALDLGLSPRLVVDGVKLANAEWAPEPWMVEVGRLEAELHLLPLLVGQVDIERVVLIDPTFRLHVNAQGEPNWSFIDELGAGDADGVDVSTQDDAIPHIHEVALAGMRLLYLDAAEGSDTAIEIDHLSIHSDARDAPLHIELHATMDQLAVDLDTQTGSLTEVLDPTGPLPVSATLSADDVALQVEGSVDDLRALTGIALRISSSGAQVGDIGAALGKAGFDLDIPRLGPYALSARVVGSGDALALEDLDLTVGRQGAVYAQVTGGVGDLVAMRRVGVGLRASVVDPTPLGIDTLQGLPPWTLSARVSEQGAGWRLRAIDWKAGASDVTGELRYTSGARSQVAGRLHSNRLDLDELFPLDQAETPSPDDGRLIPNTPLPTTQGLDEADVDLRYSAGTLQSGDTTLSDLSLGLKIRRGSVAVSGLSGDYQRAHISGGGITLRAGGELSVRGRLSGIPAGAWLRENDFTDAMSGGSADLELALAGSGRTARQWASTLDGRVVFDLRDATLKTHLLQGRRGLLARLVRTLDVAKWSKQRVQVDCAVIDLVARGGTLHTDYGVAVELDRLGLAGVGDVKLGDETLSMDLYANLGKGLSIASLAQGGLIVVDGALASPDVRVDTRGAARGAVDAGKKLVSGQRIQRYADPHPCRTARSGARPELDEITGTDVLQQGEALVDEVSDGVEQVAEGVHRAVRQGEKAAEQARDTVDDVKNGVEDVKSGVEDVKDSVDQAKDAINDLGDSLGLGGGKKKNKKKNKHK